jgi:hypothetical protein
MQHNAASPGPPAPQAWKRVGWGAGQPAGRPASSTALKLKTVRTDTKWYSSTKNRGPRHRLRRSPPQQPCLRLHTPRRVAVFQPRHPTHPAEEEGRAAQAGHQRRSAAPASRPSGGRRLQAAGQPSKELAILIMPRYIWYRFLRRRAQAAQQPRCWRPKGTASARSRRRAFYKLPDRGYTRGGLAPGMAS